LEEAETARDLFVKDRFLKRGSKPKYSARSIEATDRAEREGETRRHRVRHPDRQEGASAQAPASSIRRTPGRGQEAQEGRQSRERPANLPVDRDPGAPEPGLFRHAGPKRRRGDAAAVASRRGGGIPWRAEIPGEDRLPSCGVTAADRSTDFRFELKPLKARSRPTASLCTALKPLLGAGPDAAQRRGDGSGWGGRYGDRRQRTPGGARGAERRPGDRKENPLKGEPQERSRYETRPAGSRGERSVRRPSKPEDAAQPGVVSPVQVAPRHLMRCRGERPQESASVPIRRLVRRGTADGPARVILWSRAKPRRGSRVDSSSA
jgi:hypothetical protein